MNQFDVVVVGAGIHGVGVAQAAAAAGYSVLVLEKNTVASGTSCKSSKLIHGGLRYLESAQFLLVRKALKERKILCRIAPDLVKLQPFNIPVYKNTQRHSWQIRLGLSLYALLGGLHKDNLFKTVDVKQTKEREQLKQEGLNNIFQYHDGQTNDAKLTNAVMNSAKALGAELIFPATVTTISKTASGFNLCYEKNNIEEQVQASVVVNAAGPWVNELHNIVAGDTESLDIDLVQGTHIILDVPAPSGIYYVEASDQRAVFIMPYEKTAQMKTMVGTTEKLFKGNPDDVKPSREEVDYLVKTYQSYFVNQKDITVIEQFAGLRVLPKDDGHMFHRERDTILHWEVPGILSLYGGKLTAYRSTSELVIKKIKPLLGKRQRIAHTDQLYLSI